MYVIAIKNMLQVEFFQVVPVSLLQPKDTMCCRARDAVEYESGQSYAFHSAVTVFEKFTKSAILVGCSLCFSADSSAKH